MDTNKAPAKTTNQIEWTVKAVKQLRKLPQQAQTAISHDAGEKLAVFPDCVGIKSLTNHAYGYRLRVGNYRVFFDFEGGAACIVTIEEVKKRDERTY